MIPKPVIKNSRELIKALQNFCYVTLIKKTKQDFSQSTSETNENISLFVFISTSTSFGVCIYVQCFFEKYPLDFIKEYAT